MLRITTNESDNAMEIKLEGRIAGPWAEELDRVWVETAPRLGSRRLTVNLSNVIYADAAGKRVLREIVAQVDAELVTSNLWAHYLAEEVAGKAQKSVVRGGQNASNG